MSDLSPLQPSPLPAEEAVLSRLLAAVPEHALWRDFINERWDQHLNEEG